MSAAVHDSAPRLRGLDLLRAIAEGTAGAVGDEFLRGLVQHLAEAFGAKLVIVGEPMDADRVRVIEGWYDGAHMDEPFEYETDGLPCALVVEKAVVAFPDALTKHFPEDQIAVDMGLESYLAVCLRAADGTHLGHLALLDSRPMEAGEGDLTTLQVFASRAAAELERRRQASLLEASRTRAIQAADAERRRIGRDLHDGAQQRLVAVANLLTVARKNTGEPLIDAAAEELAAANAELRELARGLYPVALAERGLNGAVESLATGSVIAVEIDVPDLELEEPVALAAYFVICESLANAGRYAQATRAYVRAAIAGDALHVEVSDDGIGGADLASGTGLRGLVDRMEILGGTLEVTSPPGEGTRVMASIPLG
jgi:signal transduction histidine kinase